MSDMPKEIWLQGDSRKNLYDGECTWCEDQQNDYDTKYTRTDIHTEALEAIKVLREALLALRDIVDESSGVTGYHCNGDIAPWDEFKYEIGAADQALAAEIEEGKRVEELKDMKSVPVLCHDVDFGSYDNSVGVKSPWGTIVELDICMIPEIKWLWDQGIKTIESCCGHGKVDGYIAVQKQDAAKMHKLGYKPHPKAPHCFLCKSLKSQHTEAVDQVLAKTEKF